MQRKIYRSVGMDFCCWFSVAVMRFVNFREVPVKDTEYAFSPTFLIPVNSALNFLLGLECLIRYCHEIELANGIPRLQNKVLEL